MEQENERLKDSKVHKEIVNTIYEGTINQGHIPQSLKGMDIIELFRALIMIEQHGVYANSRKENR